MIAKIAVSVAAYHIDRPYDYFLPENIAGLALPGMRVSVPFGAGNKMAEGIILSLLPETGDKPLKSVDSLLDGEPLLGDDSLKLALWMSDRYFCTVYSALRAMLPAGVWEKGGGKRLGDKTVSIVHLNIAPDEAAGLASARKSRAPHQSAVLQLLAASGSMPIKEICTITGAPSSTVKTLEKQGILAFEKREVFRRPGSSMNIDTEHITLNEEQRAAYDSLAPLLGGGRPEAALLYGVTGSGKTLVYIKLIEKALESGKTAIVLVPEIALTPQAVSIFASYFGDSVAVLHSALGTGERYDEWKRIRSGEVRVVVGTRSAIFAPLENIGLIVLDEEQEHTYKSENSPRYHARDIAKYRVAHSGALLLLSSATPSVESMHSALAGKYKIFRIDSRFNKRDLPAVRLIDMKKELKDGNNGSISSVLKSEIESNIRSNEQSILFINRRGANPLVACGECGFTYKCDNCSVSMTYHSATNLLLCHYCGHSLKPSDKCPECGGKLRFMGAGTQKVETELSELFPGIGVIRMDADTVSQMRSHDKLLNQFREGGAHVLLGTQMVTKGLDFENVTLVGVLSADSMLYMGDYRAHERAFSLITQVVGRSGRGEKPGRAFIQTFTPDHEVIALASRQDYIGFYEREIMLRDALGSPPIHDLFAISASGGDEAAVMAACAKLRGALVKYFEIGGDAGNVKVLGPAPAPIPKVKNKYRYRVMISCDNSKRVRDTIAHTLREFARDKLSRGVSVYADAGTYE
ncbi:MAG: primosomal protein N' [Oscillospiraceae bacterium]|nr:primosomal protein N' [Oscillospiraceae bacterium]